MTGSFQPPFLLRAFRSLRVPRKLGLGEMLWGNSLMRRGITWVDFGDLRWKLNLANDTHRWLVYGEYEEPGVRRLLKRVLNAESVVIDSGANIGQMVLMYLRYGSPAMIRAFEPTPGARRWLEECVSANDLRNVSVSPLALSGRVGSAYLVEHDFSRKEGAQNRITEEDTGKLVQETTLDAYAAVHHVEHVRFWKLDTEGHELPALRGAEALLQRGAIDYLYVETANAGTAITQFLGKTGYVAVSLGLDRTLTAAEVAANFTNVFVSARVARKECGLALSRD